MDIFMLQVKVAPIPFIFILMIAMETYILVLEMAVKQVYMILLGLGIFKLSYLDIIFSQQAT